MLNDRAPQIAEAIARETGKPLWETKTEAAAMIGKGIMLDHATGFVVGETAAIGDHCSILHAVTLGGTGKADEDRHPKIGDGVLIGAGAKILGNIRIGQCSRVAAGSVVLKDVPPRTTADLRATSPESVALARGLKQHGVVFVGPITAYAAMQACGLVDDHLAGCHRSKPPLP